MSHIASPVMAPVRPPHMPVRSVRHRVRRRLQRVARLAVRGGLPSAWLDYWWVEPETVAAYMARHGGATDAGDRWEIVHPRTVFPNPLPGNVDRRESLPDDRGWWGFAFRDVPARESAATLIATCSDARVIPWVEPGRNQFRPTIVNRDGRAFALREMAFRSGHGRMLRTGRQGIPLDTATWILERSYDNHSHWLTAHLPKLILLKQRGQLGDVLLPRHKTPVMVRSMCALGLDPEAFAGFDPDRPLLVKSLTFLDTDRFRPELLRSVRTALTGDGTAPGHRRIYISRARAPRRRLVNEEDIWPLLSGAGFERVFMEDLDFDEQVALMAQTRVLFAPHGAGLTNMMFCPAGAQIVEIADLTFPNPNFFALASAMGHGYWLLPGRGRGEDHPLERDLWIDPAAVRALLGQLPS